MLEEHQRAKAWREAHGLTLKQLSTLSGYGRSTIEWMEKGSTPPRKPEHMAGGNAAKRKINQFCWMRYKLVMAGVDQQIRSGNKFEWEA